MRKYDVLIAALAVASNLGWLAVAAAREPGEPGPRRVVAAPEYHSELGMSLEGTRIVAILPGGPAAQAGLRAGDVIRQVGSEPVDTWEELSLELSSQAPHTFAQLRIYRGGERRQVKLWISPDATTAAEYARANGAGQATRYQSNYRPATAAPPGRPAPTPRTRSVADEDYVNSGLETARRRSDPNNDLWLRSRRGERDMDRAQREFDRNTNRLASKGGAPGDLDTEPLPEPPGYHVVVPGDLSGPRINQIDRGPEQYYGRPGATYSERGDWPIPGEKGGISRDRRQVTADEGMSIDRAGRTSAEDRTQRLVDEFSTHSDRQNGRPDPVSGENDPHVRTVLPSGRAPIYGRPWRPDASGGGSAFPAHPYDRGINPPNEGSNLAHPRDIYGDLNLERSDVRRTYRDDD